MRVLVADDDYGSQLVAQAAVEQSGHECIAAADGAAAWELYQRHHPQAVVSDLEMPGMDGLALCRAIREADTDSYTYLVLVTSHGSKEAVVAGMNAGADDYMTKPLDPFTLHTRLLVAERVTSLHADLARYRAALAEQARTDPLTKLRNRLTLAEDLEQLRKTSEHAGEQFSVVLCDVDYFKRYNDLYGHQAGDAALRAVADTLAKQVRRGDGVYRFGGEEFLIVLPRQSPSGARAFMGRAFAAVRELKIAHSGNPPGILTLSGGIAACTDSHRVSVDALLNEADLALYSAKASGRNRVMVSGSAEGSLALHGGS
jgi:two-component system chemotaxis response regulator CheY